MTAKQVEARRTIESLRAGVPSRAAVKRLGTSQERISNAFADSLEKVRSGSGSDPLVLAANYGDGKSHLLKYLQTIAERDGFVTAYLVVSPEMPLGRPHVVLQSLAEAAEAPHVTGKALRGLVAQQRAADVFGGLRRWVEAVELEDRFAAMLLLFAEYWVDEELRQQILDDIEGKPLKLTEIRKRLKALGRQEIFQLQAGRQAALAHSRLRLYGQICRACTGAGLVVFFDELERLVLFTRKQRFAAYQEIGWWCRRAAEEASGIVPVFAMTRGLVEEAIDGGKLDAQEFGAIGADLDPEHKALGEAGLELLQAKPLGLQPPTPEQLDDIEYRVHQLYGEAYDTQPAELPATQVIYTSLRQRIRSWITGWDLQRHDPAHRPNVLAEEVEFDEHEVPDELLAGDERPEE